MLSFWRSVRLVAKVLCLRLGAAMRRREFIGLIGGTAAWPLAVRAQQPKKIPRVGYLAGGPPNEYADTLFRSLRELGYVDGVNIKIDVRFAYGRLELLPGLANELISLKPDVLIGGGRDRRRYRKTGDEYHSDCRGCHDQRAPLGAL